MFVLAKLPENLLPAAIEILKRYWPSFALGIQNTLLISLTGTIIGMIIGLIIGGARAIKVEPRDSLIVKILKRIMHVLITVYIEVFRGTPMMVQSVFIYYALKPALGWTPIVAGIVVISVNTGAYMAEIVRSGIQSVDKGQTEAARSLGMSNIQTMLLVVLPQAIKNAFPAMGNEFIVNIKDSSVLNAISVTELYFQSSSIAGSIFRYTDTFLVTAAIYFCLTFTTSRILLYIEHHMSNTKTSYPASQTVPHAIKTRSKGAKI